MAFNTLKSKFILLCGAILVLVLFVIFSLLYGTHHFSEELEETSKVSKALRNHTLGDMVHDGLRSDVYAALMAKELGTGKADILADLKEKAGLFNKVFKENNALDLPKKAKDAIAGVSDPLNEYVRFAESMVELAFSDREKAVKQLAEFNKKFDALEKAMLDAGDKIEAVAGEINAEVRTFGGTASWVSWVLAALLLLANGALLYFAVFKVSQPLSRMDGVMQELSDGNEAVDIPYLERKDEIGSMAASVEVFRNNAVERARLEKVREDEQKVKQERQDKIDLLISGFREKVTANLENVRHNTGQMKNAAKHVSEVADKTSAQASSASGASSVASQNVEAVSVAAEQLAQSISEISHQITVTTDTVKKAAQVTETTDQRVTELSNAAQRIGDVLAMISDIAEQTNLLALNATIEAARAGESGKGFAVVASEVKNLATQTAKATEDIAAQISNIQDETEAAVSAIREIASITVEVNDNTSAIAAAVEQQSASTTEISKNVSSATSGTATVTNNITSVAAVVDETSASATQMLNAVSDVSQRTDELNDVIDSFLKDVASA